MTYGDMAALFAFVLVATIAPGPNNLMLVANAANFGVRRSISYMAGVATGTASMILVLGVGMDQIYEAIPWFQWVLKVLGSAYLLYLAYKIGTTKVPPQHTELHGHPIQFWQIFGFQWLNPKAWTIAITAVAFLEQSNNWYDVLTIAIIFFILSVFSSVVWALVGSSLSRLLADPVKMRRINITLGCVLVFAVFPLWQI
ncbi:MAG: LysE family translocator [Pseudomonadota bacterium]